MVLDSFLIHGRDLTKDGADDTDFVRSFIRVTGAP